MSGRKILLFVVAAAILGIVVYSFSSKKKGSYADDLRMERLEKDQNYRTSTESPIKDKAGFQGLKYFPADSTYEVFAKLEETESTKTFAVQMTGGQTETYTLYGKVRFELQGKTCELLVFESTEAGTLFIPFKDQTSGKESYGGGRYLDIPESDITGNRVTIDFNKAYNPYCAYSPEYTCPIPPKENNLPLAIRAGELAYHE
ncbi:DUF1684 domain-containing protein [Siphonobacter sp.]|uniref:DUF1684 domain-containing protein n=1 Tax=Siphonobacter sp. TaxID=1869184 RepID=UPI003B3B0B20